MTDKEIKWEEYRCPFCQCGPSIPADQPKAKERVAEYIKNHKCKGKK